MSTSLTAFEQKIFQLTERLLEEHRSLLSGLELQADFRGIKVLDPSPATRSSELEVVFRRGRDIADIFEFFVEQDGVPNATFEEIEEWLRTELDELPARHS